MPYISSFHEALYFRNYLFFGLEALNFMIIKPKPEIGIIKILMAELAQRNAVVQDILSAMVPRDDMMGFI